MRSLLQWCWDDWHNVMSLFSQGNIQYEISDTILWTSFHRATFSMKTVTQYYEPLFTGQHWVWDQWHSVMNLFSQGNIEYEISGYFAAPGYFNINPSTGVITVRSDLATDVAISYLVSGRQSVCLLVLLSVSVFACQSACVSACSFVCSTVCVLACLPVCLSFCLSVCLPICLSVYLPTSLSLCLLDGYCVCRAVVHSI